VGKERLDWVVVTQNIDAISLYIYIWQKKEVKLTHLVVSHQDTNSSLFSLFLHELQFFHLIKYYYFELNE